MSEPTPSASATAAPTPVRRRFGPAQRTDFIRNAPTAGESRQALVMLGAALTRRLPSGDLYVGAMSQLRNVPSMREAADALEAVNHLIADEESAVAAVAGTVPPPFDAEALAAEAGAAKAERKRVGRALREAQAELDDLEDAGGASEGELAKRRADIRKLRRGAAELKATKGSMVETHRRRKAEADALAAAYAARLAEARRAYRERVDGLWDAAAGGLFAAMSLNAEDADSLRAFAERTPDRFVERALTHLGRMHQSPSLLTLSENRSAKEQRDRERLEWRAFATEHNVPARAEEVNRLLDRAEEVMNTFGERTGFLLGTVPNFDRRGAAMDRMLPEGGLVSFLLRHRTWADLYDDFVTGAVAIDAATREAMAAGCRAFAELLGEHSAEIPYVNGVTIIEGDRETVGIVQRSRPSTAVAAELVLIADTLAGGDAGELYASSQFDPDAEQGYGFENPLSAVIRYVNPFRGLSPVYVFARRPGMKHAAIDKVRYWVRLVNAECEDLECIPCALAVKANDVAVVSDAAIAAVRTATVGADVVSMNVDQPRAYQHMLAAVDAPWIVVAGVAQTGTWTVLAASTPDLLGMRPLEWDALRSTVVALHVRDHHATRIVELSRYDECLWRYERRGYAVVAKVDQNSGMGPPVLKLLRGHERLRSYYHACLGPLTFEWLQAYAAQDHRGLGAVLDAWRTEPDLLEPLVNDAYDAHTKDGERPFGTLAGEDTPLSPYTLTPADALERIREEWEAERASGWTGKHLRYWRALELPSWMTVKLPAPGQTGWEVCAASDDEMLGITPEIWCDAYPQVVVLVVGAAGPRGFAGVGRLVEAFVPVDGLTFDTRGCFQVARHPDGVNALLAAASWLAPLDPETTTLASEGPDTDAEGKPVPWTTRFGQARCAVVHSVKLSKAGDIRSIDFDAVPRMQREAYGAADSCNAGRLCECGGAVTAETIQTGAPDLIRLWLDKDGTVWVITGCTPYYLQGRQGQPTSALQPIHVAMDYETVNRLTVSADGDGGQPHQETVPALLSFALHDGDGYLPPKTYTGEHCTRAFVQDLERMTLDSDRHIHVTTFHGALFDAHLLLHGLSGHGDFGSIDSDRVTLVGNKLLGITWRRRVTFGDMRRFTGSSLAAVSRELGVRTPKSKIDLDMVQRLFERPVAEGGAGGNLPTLKTVMSALPATELLRDAAADAQWPEFVAEVSSLNAWDAYARYCERDAQATLECWLKLRETCQGLTSFHAFDSNADDRREELAPVYDIDAHLTMPGMAYRIYRAGLPRGTLGRSLKPVPALPPVASTYPLHCFLQESLIGGRSEVYPQFGSGVLTEPHGIADVVSLYPYAAMAARMPYGEPYAVVGPGVTLEPWVEESVGGAAKRCAFLPVPHCAGVYRCTLIRQPPGYPVVPYRAQAPLAPVELDVVLTRRKARERGKGTPLDWQREGPFDCTLNVVTIRQVRAWGGEVRVHWGVVYPAVIDDLFDQSLWAWKDIKQRQDTLMEEDARRRAADPAAVPEANTVVRTAAKLLSNSLLGKTAHKLKDTDHQVLHGSSAIRRFHEDQRRSSHPVSLNGQYSVHLLAPDARLNACDQLSQHNKAALATLTLDPADAFDHSDGSHGSFLSVPEIIVSSTMLAYSHYHMGAAMRRMYAAKAVRGIETDGIHYNPELYERWCEAQGIPNPYWIDGELPRVRQGSPLFDRLFMAADVTETVAPIPGPLGTAQPRPYTQVRVAAAVTHRECAALGPAQQRFMATLGSFYCVPRAQEYARAHGLPVPSAFTDYGYFKEELAPLKDGTRPRYHVAYLARKFYAYVEEGKPESTAVMRAKGIGGHTRLGGDVARLQLRQFSDAQTLTDGPLGAEAVMPRTGALAMSRRPVNDRTLRAVGEALSAAPPALTFELYRRLARGEGIDVADRRFQGTLSKLHALGVRYIDEAGQAPHAVLSGSVATSPLLHSFALKRIEPLPEFIVRADTSTGQLRLWRGAELLSVPDAALLRSEVLELFATGGGTDAVVDRWMRQRGFVTRLGSSAHPGAVARLAYVPNATVLSLFRLRKAVLSNERPWATEDTATGSASGGSERGGTAGVRDGAAPVPTAGTEAGALPAAAGGHSGGGAGGAPGGSAGTGGTGGARPVDSGQGRGDSPSANGFSVSLGPSGSGSVGGAVSPGGYIEGPAGDERLPVRGARARRAPLRRVPRL